MADFDMKSVIEAMLEKAIASSAPALRLRPLC
jgi:hypothetical protein